MIVVGIGEYAVTEDERESLVTHALGSCVAVIVRCPMTKKTAMAHIVLPEMDGSQKQSFTENKIGYYANDIIPRIIKDFTKERVCRIEQLQVTVTGGADSRNPRDVFKVGPRNVQKVNDCLRLLGIRPYYIDVGGNVSRTVEIIVDNGQVTIRKQEMIV